MIDAIAQRDGLREGKSSVESALRNVKAAISGGLITGTVVNTIDVKTLACALRRVMISGIQLHGLPAQQKLAADTTSSVKSTSEGLARKIKGKHVIVSMGKSGVLWCADKDIVSRTGRDNIPVQTSGRQVSPSFIVVDDSTAIKLFPPSTIPLPQGQTSLTPEQAQRLNTNGAGDAFCAGVISSLFDESCKELDSTCINAGLDAAANQIARSIS